MALIKKPVNGMKDVMPDEMAVRNYVIDMIRKTYAAFGFSSIDTPAVEHIENLLSKQGGDNEKLIFKILKRGEKLHLDTAETEADVTDSGLRYDLTLPLSRYYANHANELPAPFKALQIGPVWRADRPQRGRFRQFTQCDIDILGEGSCLAEIELILATSTALMNMDFSDFTIRINDRRILKDMAKNAGFEEAQYDSVFITLDKMDKIGEDGVKAELTEKFSAELAESFMNVFKEAGPAYDLPLIMSAVDQLKTGDFKIVFDPTLVRGMSYYTGPIFEISMDGFGGSVGGGGRYDGMIGKFTGQETPACGFSIGFERIIMLLMEKGFKVPGSEEKIAFLVEKKMPGERLTEVLAEAQALRAQGKNVSVNIMKKNRKFQKDQLIAEGYTEIKEYFNG
ncbi:MAG: histidine--tRNA ligase [Lachnospiraceae bacterium]|nr:histidine--tRNA ligase [Lachnospiraceae bacterium]